MSFPSKSQTIPNSVCNNVFEILLLNEPKFILHHLLASLAQQIFPYFELLTVSCHWNLTDSTDLTDLKVLRSFSLIRHLQSSLAYVRTYISDTRDG